jgi:hypothetical protein
MNPRVRDVRPITGYRLQITFTNGEVGVYDCRPLLDFGVFRELREEAYFRQVRAAGGTAVWPHEQDICPDTLYLDARREGAMHAGAGMQVKSTGILKPEIGHR